MLSNFTECNSLLTFPFTCYVSSAFFFHLLHEHSQKFGTLLFSFRRQVIDLFSNGENCAEIAAMLMIQLIIPSNGSFE